MNTQPKHRELSQRMGPDKPWEEVTENFECPICGLGKDAFEEA
jgi:rubredoxin